MEIGKMPATYSQMVQKKKKEKYVDRESRKKMGGRERKQVWKKMLKVVVKATVQGCYVNYLVTFL